MDWFQRELKWSDYNLHQPHFFFLGNKQESKNNSCKNVWERHDGAGYWHSNTIPSLCLYVFGKACPFGFGHNQLADDSLIDLKVNKRFLSLILHDAFHLLLLCRLPLVSSDQTWALMSDCGILTLIASTLYFIFFTK